jgi:hypothetical protein
MKYSQSKPNRKICRHDPDHRAQLGYRLRMARCNQGWSVAAAAKYFQVTERTWHNWETGVHRIPFAVYKLCRVLARLELPGDAWAGWSFQGGLLITPENHQIAPHDGAWWSLMIRKAHGFIAAYNEATRLRQLLDSIGATQRPTGCASAPEVGASAPGLVSSKTSLAGTSREVENRHQSDVTMTSWPTLYDFLTPSTPLDVLAPTTSESALTPSCALPWTPTCGVQLTLNRPPQGPHLGTSSHLKQAVNRTNPRQLAAPPRPPDSAKSNARTLPPGFGPSAKTSGRLAGANATGQATASNLPGGAP